MSFPRLSTPDRARRGRARLALVAFFAALLFAVVPAASASAHSGPWELVVAPDGVGGLSAFGRYIEDGHVVTEIIDPVATAVSTDGRSAGPVSLVSSAEGEGLWVTSEPFLAEGEWTVTVVTTTPAAVTSTTTVSVAPPAPPAADESESATSDGGASPDETVTTQSDAAVETDGSSVLPMVLWVIAGALAVAVVITVVVLRRRRETAK